MADKITYDDKVDSRPLGTDPTKEIQAQDMNDLKKTTNDIIDEVGIGGVSDNTVVVSINTGGPTNKIKNTLDAITDSSVNKPYLVSVRPGAGTLEYVEDDFTIPPYVSLISEGGSSLTFIKANTTTGIQITMSEGCSLRGFTIKDKTAGTAVSVTNVGSVDIASLNIEDCNDGIVINNSSVAANINNIYFLEDVQGITNDGIRIEAGQVTAEAIIALGTVSIDGAMVRNTGLNSILTLTNVLAFSPNVNLGVSMEDNSRTNMFDISMNQVYDAVVQSGGSTSTVTNVKAFNVQNNGFRAEAGVGGASYTTFTSVLFEAAPGGLDANITTSDFTGVGGPAEIRIEQSYFDPGSTVIAQIYNLFEGDEANKFISEVHVGSPTRGRECALGEGDSHVQMLVYTSDDSISYTDVTAAAKSASGSTFTFESINIDSCIYMTNLYPDTAGNPLPFYGFKYLCDTAAVFGAGNIVIEYYNTNVGWIDADYMVTQGDRRFYQYGKEIFHHTGSHHVRGPIRLGIETDPNLTWDVNDPPTTGTNRYWIRIRIASTITSVPQLQQFKLHGHRFEVNSDGWTEYFGNARPVGGLGFTLGAGRELAGSMANQSIWIDQDIGIGLTDNQFSATSQYYGWSGTMPDDLDTGSGVSVKVFARANGAGTVDLQVLYAKITAGDTAYITNPGLIPLPTRRVATASATFTGAGDVQLFDFLLDVSDYRARKDPADGETESDVIVITINPTTIPVNIQMLSAGADFYKWCEGGHI